jgi:peptidoglycan/LPS O-acetylase OafA/YrhL
LFHPEIHPDSHGNKNNLEHKAEYLSNLTPLRGIAALLVAIFHFEMAIARFVPANLTMFLRNAI